MLRIVRTQTEPFLKHWTMQSDRSQENILEDLIFGYHSSIWEPSTFLRSASLSSWKGDDHGNRKTTRDIWLTRGLFGQSNTKLDAQVAVAPTDEDVPLFVCLRSCARIFYSNQICPLERVCVFQNDRPLTASSLTSDTFLKRSASSNHTIRGRSRCRSLFRDLSSSR